MPSSLSCQKLHYSAPNGFPGLNQAICRRAPSMSELIPQRWIVGGDWGVRGWEKKGRQIHDPIHKPGAGAAIIISSLKWTTIHHIQG